MKETESVPDFGDICDISKGAVDNNYYYKLLKLGSVKVLQQFFGVFFSI